MDICNWIDRNCKQAQGVSQNGFLRSLETSMHVTSLVTDSNETLLRLKTSHLHHSIRRSISGEGMTRKTMNALCSFDLRRRPATSYTDESF